MKVFCSTKTGPRWSELLKNKSYVRVRIRIPAALKEYECGLTPSATLKENMDLLISMIGNEISSSCQFDRPVCVFDETSGTSYRMDQTLTKCGITDGSVLLICWPMEPQPDQSYIESHIPALVSMDINAVFTGRIRPERWVLLWESNHFRSPCKSQIHIHEHFTEH